MVERVPQPNYLIYVSHLPLRSERWIKRYSGDLDPRVVFLTWQSPWLVNLLASLSGEPPTNRPGIAVGKHSDFKRTNANANTKKHISVNKKSHHEFQVEFSNSLAESPETMAWLFVLLSEDYLLHSSVSCCSESIFTKCKVKQQKHKRFQIRQFFWKIDVWIKCQKWTALPDFRVST